MVPFTFGSGAMNEGAFAQISCVVTEGDEPLKLSWSFHGHNLTTGSGIQITDIGTRTSILMIHNVGHRHVGDYTCKASNNAGSSTHTAILNVNGNLLVRARSG